MTESTGNVPGRIFMSYRREDTDYPAAWLYERLANHFGISEVFKDVDTIEPGDDFVQVIDTAVGSCDVLLALIGARWLTIIGQDGRRRLDNPGDFVRLEIEAALARNVRVIPILVEGTRMPGADELPASLAKLVRRQALELSSSRFETDTRRLLRVLDRTITGAQKQTRQQAEEEAARRRERVEQLQGQIRERAAAQDWDAVVAASGELAALDPAAADPDGLASTAREKITRRQQAEEGAHDGIIERPAVVQAFDAYVAIGAYAAINSVAFGVDRRWLAVSSTAGPVVIWDITTAQQQLHLTHSAWAVLFSADGRWLVTADKRTARIWDTTTGQQLLGVSHRSSRDHAVALTPDGRWLATGSPGNAVCIWDAADSRALMTISLGQRLDSWGAEDAVDGLAFSPDGRWLATASTDRTACIWDAATGQAILKVTHGGAVSAVAFSPDGRWLATASTDRTACIWDAATGQAILKVTHGGAVSAVAFSPDGRWLATASTDKTARIWDVDSGQMLSELPHKKAVRNVAFSPDGDRLATASKPSAQVWALCEGGTGLGGQPRD